VSLNDCGLGDTPGDATVMTHFNIPGLEGKGIL